MRITLKIKTVSGKDFKSACKAAEIVVAMQALKDTIPFVPALTGVFSNMARTDGNEIVYTGDQARYLYEGKVMVDAATGKGPMNIPDVGLRWHKGQRSLRRRKTLFLLRTCTRKLNPIGWTHPTRKTATSGRVSQKRR